MDEQARKYWDAKIAKWARSCYREKSAAGGDGVEGEGVVGETMSRLRSSVNARLDTAAGLLEPIAPGRRFLELGCGAGELALRLADAGAAHVEAWDISGEAVRIARERAGALGLADRCRFEQVDLNEAELPEADVTIGLGLLDWITLEEVDRLAAKLRSPHFLFSYSERDNSLAEIVHRFYLVYRLRIQRKGVHAEHYRREDVLGIFERHGYQNPSLLKTREMRFGVLVYKLPERPDRG